MRRTGGGVDAGGGGGRAQGGGRLLRDGDRDVHLHLVLRFRFGLQRGCDGRRHVLAARFGRRRFDGRLVLLEVLLRVLVLVRRSREPLAKARSGRRTFFLFVGPRGRRLGDEVVLAERRSRRGRASHFDGRRRSRRDGDPGRRRFGGRRFGGRHGRWGGRRRGGGGGTRGWRGA